MAVDQSERMARGGRSLQVKEEACRQKKKLERKR